MDEVSGSVDRKDSGPLLICSFKRSTESGSGVFGMFPTTASSIKHNHLHEAGIPLKQSHFPRVECVVISSAWLE